MSGRLIRNRTALRTGVDLDSYNIPGIYALDNPTNAPAAGAYLVTVYKAAASVAQIAVALAGGLQSVRIFDGASWGTWEATGGSMTGAEIAAALDAELGSSVWQGGTMSGAALVAAIDAQLSSSVWQGGTMTGAAIAAAINAELGSAVWQGGAGATQTTIASGSLTGTTVAVTGIPQTFNHLIIKIVDATHNGTTRRPLVQVSANNGSSYDATQGNYPGFTWNGTAIAASGLATIINRSVGGNGSELMDQTGYLFGYQTQFPIALSVATFAGGAAISVCACTATFPVNAIRFLWDGSADFDGGTYAVIGVGAGG